MTLPPLPTPRASRTSPAAQVIGTGPERPPPTVTVRRAKASDVRDIKRLVDCYAGRILLEKSLANLFEDVAEFWVAERDADGAIVGCGALHVLWEDLGEIRTVATDPAMRGHGVGHAVCAALLDEARAMGLARIFVLTFEVTFFASLGFGPIAELELTPEATAELRRSYDAGVAEFLDLPYVKPNTLGNTRMLRWL